MSQLPLFDHQSTWITDSWYNCYRENWGELLTSHSYVHPAKVRFGLAAKIYRHITQEGWAGQHTRIVDPFGGIAGTAFHAMFYGMTWVGIELELRFCVLAGGMDCPAPDGSLCPDCANKTDDGQQELFQQGPHRFRGNLDVWRDRGLKGTGRIVQGDSRQLSAVLERAQIVVSSPPFTGVLSDSPSKQVLSGSGRNMGRSCKGDGYGSTDGNLGNLPATDTSLNIVLGSPPYNDGCVTDRGDQIDYSKAKGSGTRTTGRAAISEGYGDADGQLGNMAGTERGLDMVVSSPPFVGSIGSDDPDKRGGLYRDDKRRSDKNLTGTYGQAAGQLGSMTGTEQGLHIVISSPPFAEQQHGGGLAKPDAVYSGDGHKFGSNHGYQNQGTSEGQLANLKDGGLDAVVSSPPWENQEPSHAQGTSFHPPADVHRKMADSSYGDADGQIGNTVGQDFWTAAKQILSETYRVLAPGAHACWIVKGYIRDGRIVDFPDQWRRLCESVGFKTLHEHRAWVVEKGGIQQRLTGPDEQIALERKSFFRRDGEMKAQARIHWKTVSEEDRAVSVERSRQLLWASYRVDLGQGKDAVEPSERRVLENAQVLIYRYDGAPSLDIETRIDYETVWCMVK